MNRNARTVLFLCAGSIIGVAVVFAILVMPPFGGKDHPYRDHAVVESVAHQTSNVVSSVNFDLRGLDTLGEESILLASVMGVVILLRPADDESERQRLSSGRQLDSTRFGGYVLLPLTLLIGFDIISQGALTPGGGFQGGVILGTGFHLLYVAGRYKTLEKVRPLDVFDFGEAIGTAAFACMGISGVLASGAFLANFLPHGHIGQLLSSGTIPVLNGAVGIEVASGTMVLLAKFLEQAIVIREQKGARAGGGQ